jgi:hypothetical protein
VAAILGIGTGTWSHLRLIADADTADFLVNGSRVTTIEISSYMCGGDVLIATVFDPKKS